MSRISLGTIPKAGIGPGESLLVKASYSQPDDPGISRRHIRFNIDENAVAVPLAVSWEPPLRLTTVAPIKPNVWQLSGEVSESVKLASVESLHNDITVESFNVRDRRFAIEVFAKVNVATYCSLRCRLAPTVDQTAERNVADEVEQVLQVSLQSTAPRSIPSRLVCSVDKQGKLSGETRVLFPRVRRTERPDIKSCTLIDADGNRQSLSAQQDDLGKIALKLKFHSTSPIAAEAFSDDSKIEFLFDDGSLIHCNFQVSQE